MQQYHHRKGFTLVELMVVVSVIGILLGLFTMAMLGGRDSEVMLKSRNHLRQIAQWIDQYASSNRDTVVPSRFNYLNEDGADTNGDGDIDQINVSRVGGARFFHIWSRWGRLAFTSNGQPLPNNRRLSGGRHGPGFVGRHSLG